MPHNFDWRLQKKRSHLSILSNDFNSTSFFSTAYLFCLHNKKTSKEKKKFLESLIPSPCFSYISKRQQGKLSPEPQQEHLCLKWRFWWHFPFTGDCTLWWTNKAPKVQQPLMSATCDLCTDYASGSEPSWEYIEVRDCKCFQDITMYSVCYRVTGTQLSHMRDYKYVHTWCAVPFCCYNRQKLAALQGL